MLRTHEGLGITLRQLYEQVEEQTGVRAKQLDGPPLPLAGHRIWTVFQELASKRRWQIGMGPAVPEPIGFQDIQAYCDLMRIRLESWQLRLIGQLDGLYRSTMLGGAKTEQASSAAGLGQLMKGQV